MGYKTRGFGFSVKWYADDEAIGHWLENDLVVTSLLALLERDGYLASAEQISINLGDHEPISGVDEIRARARDWSYGVVIMTAGDPDDPDLLLHLRLETTGPHVFVAVSAERAAAQLRAHATGWVTEWSAKLAPAGLRLARGSFEPSQDDYPRPLPPRVGLIWRLGSLDQYAGLHWHSQAPERAAVLQQLQRAPLPPSAHRHAHGDVLHIAFEADLASPPSIAAARAAHERWLTPFVPSEPEDGWNEEGDRMVAPTSPEERDPLTLYDPEAQVGYKALVVQPGTHEVDEAVWDEARAIAAQRALPDGTPVRRVRLIFPRREDALLMHERVIASGFEMSMYPYDGVFWEVLPGSSRSA